MIIFGLVALNEIDYIHAVLESVKHFCDKMIVIESCAKKPFEYLYNEGFVTKDGLSTDGTTEYLQKRKDIIYIPMGVLEGTVEACAFLRFHELANEGDYIWIGTGNEVYFKNKAKEIYEILLKGECSLIDVEQIVLWKDLKHRIIGGGWGEHVLRIYKYIPGDINIYKFNDVDIIETGRFIRLFQAFSNETPDVDLYKIDIQQSHCFPLIEKYWSLPPDYTPSPDVIINDACLKLAYARSDKRVFYKVALQEIEYNNRMDNLKDYILRTNSFFNGFYADGISIVKYKGKIK